MKIEWDENKAVSNLKKHKVSFIEDPLAATVDDPDHSFVEMRFITIGESTAGRLLVVSHTLEPEEIRIISARKPTRRERESYGNG
jgi:uncharacterized DUF497 family protein